MRQQTFLFNNGEKEAEPKKKETPKKSAPVKAAAKPAKVETQPQSPVTERKEPARPKIFTVTEIVGGARAMLEKQYGDVWVAGEISGFKRHSSGHCYFTLKDANSVLPAAIFRGAAGQIKFNIENGLEVVCHGRVSLYQRGGQYQIIVNYAEPKGVGALQLAFEQLKKKLMAEGLFDKARKRPIPFLPRKIGVVTSPTGAAVRDIIKVLTRRFPNVEILLIPARVQGEGSAAEVVRGIELLNERDDVDVMIVGRGGGSIEDLWAFNEEVVARAIYASRVPVISAVGHEVDFTIADFVADFRAPTPSAAAEHAVPVIGELLQLIGRGRRQLVINLQNMIKNRGDRLGELKLRLAPPTKSFPDYYRYIDNLKERMTYSAQILVKQKESSLKALEAELNHLSPLAVLSKGYSVITHKGKKGAIRASSGLKTGDALSMQFSKGSAEAKVTKVID